MLTVEVGNDLGLDPSTPLLLFPPATAERTGRANCLISVTSRTSSPASSPNRFGARMHAIE
jgi:hypothetical protein